MLYDTKLGMGKGKVSRKILAHVFSPSSYTCALDNVADNCFRATSLYPSLYKFVSPSDTFLELSSAFSGLILSLEALIP